MMRPRWSSLKRAVSARQRTTTTILTSTQSGQQQQQRLLVTTRAQSWSSSYSEEPKKSTSSSSTSTAKTIKKVQVDEKLKASIKEFDIMKPRPLSLRRILEVSTSAESIKELNSFLQEEFRIRCAERICMLEERVPNFDQIEELNQVYNKHITSFVEMSSHSPSHDFIPVVRSIVDNSRDEIPLLCKGMSRLVHTHNVDEKFMNKFMNEFILNRIGSNVLMSQYLAVATGDDPPHPTSIVDPHCNVTKICQDTAKQVQKLCFQETNYRPNIQVESYDMEHFAFIPNAIQYILQELLKNSAVASAKQKLKRKGLSKYGDDTIKVVVCADESRVMIFVGDKASGIPFGVSPHVWSYLYTTKKRQEQEEQEQQPDIAGDLEKSGGTDLGGFGVGLPLSRLYASYLGGTIKLISLPGYGTHAYVFLPRLPEKMVESVPIRSTGWDASKQTSSDGYIL